MKTELATFSAAPLDRTARVVTRGVWLLALALALIGLGLVATGGTRTGGFLLLAAALDAGLIWYLGRLQPVAYVVEDRGFSVRRRGTSAKHFSGSSSAARRGRLGLRVVGDGGGYGYLGRYRAEGRTVHAFVTNRDRVVLLDVGESAVAVSPTDPEAFIAEVERAA